MHKPSRAFAFREIHCASGVVTAQSDEFVGLMSLKVIDHAVGHRQPLDKRITDVCKNFIHRIVKALGAHDQLIATGFDRKRLLELHTQLLTSLRWSRTSSLRDHPSTPLAIQYLVLHLSNVLQRCSNAMNDNDVDDSRAGKAKNPGYGDEGGWEDDLEDDPLLKTNLLQPQFTEYAIQILLFLGAPSLNNDDARYTLNNDDVRCTPSEADIVINAILRFRDRITANEDLIHTLYAIGHVLSRSVLMDDDRLRPVTPFFTRALHSSSSEMVATAYRVLNDIGEMLWESEDTSRSSPALVAAPLVAVSANTERFTQGSVRGLTGWLAASVREDSWLAVSIDEASAQSLFISQLYGREQEDERHPKDWSRATVWSIAYVFFSRWSATLSTRASSSNRDAAGASEKPMRFFAIIFTFIQHVFLLRPSAALFFGLDVACETLIQRAKAWKGARAQRLGRYSDLAEHSELGDLPMRWRHGGLTQEQAKLGT
ncbi:hypothetical protein FRB96_008053 [Tulasnella sp. 330]|nr:hypothetical protein FRB96_008053 [Tulasnella sp. 330]KAG8873122.1 hypothetical protein FRB98_009180 [Tulasnella sp. 332]